MSKRLARSLAAAPMMGHWLLRAARWARNPPSAGRVKLVLVIIALCVALYTVEQIYGWPEALTPERASQRGYRP